jgi:hypothetical protein
MILEEVVKFEEVCWSQRSPSTLTTKKFSEQSATLFLNMLFSSSRLPKDSSFEG